MTTISQNLQAATPSEIMDLAVATPGGIKVTLPSQEHAVRLRMQCYTARRAERKRNLRSLELEVSDWDGLVFTFEDAAGCPFSQSVLVISSGTPILSISQIGVSTP